MSCNLQDISSIAFCGHTELGTNSNRLIDNLWRRTEVDGWLNGTTFTSTLGHATEVRFLQNQERFECLYDYSETTYSMASVNSTASELSPIRITS